MRLGSFLLLVVVYGAQVVERQRRYFEALDFPLLVFLYGMYIVGRQRRYLDAGVFSASGCFVWRAPSRAST